MEEKNAENRPVERKGDCPKQEQSLGPEAEKAELEESKYIGYDLFLDFQKWNATRLQAWWRMIRLRREFFSLKQAIVLIQTVYKECPPSQRKKQDLTDEKAKAKIWRCWISYRDRKAFQVRAAEGCVLPSSAGG